MKRLFIFFAALAILLTACAAPPADFPASSPGPSAEATRTRRPSQTPGPTKTLIPSHTPRPSNTITPIPPLPTIPTFSPTFDVRTIVTATPAPKAECPIKNTSVNFLTPTPDPSLSVMEPQDIRLYILDFLNSGGTPEKIAKAFNRAENSYYIKDLTGDGIPEFILNWDNVLIFGCKNKSYSVIFEISNPIPDISSNVEVFYIGDMTLDGIPELLIGGRAGMGTISTFGHEVIGWDGKTFRQMVLPGENPDEWRSNGWLFTHGLGKNSTSIWSNWNIKDVDKNGTLELVLSGDLPIGIDSARNGPWRAVTKSYEWNGEFFVLLNSEIEPPIYRFQAVQDADQLFFKKTYAEALALYQETIFSDQLKPWSVELAKNFRDFVDVTYYTSEEPTPTPVAPDPTEYPRLAAYAYYRMILLHTFLGEMDAAQIKYATLQEKFPADSPGYPYVEMATEFWDAYQSSGLTYEACAAAIAYADAHPEILTPLGSDYHGMQSHQYQPADVCPFR